MSYQANSERETIEIGHQFGLTLSANTVVCLFGDLGAGKTTFLKGVVQAVTENLEDQVNSPTFVYLNIYEGKKTVYHFDLYRMRDEDQFLSMGFDDLFFANGICCIEWPERIKKILPKHFTRVDITHVNENTRQIIISDE